MSEIKWTVRENAFLDFWEQIGPGDDKSDIGKSRTAFMCGMMAATHFERSESAERIADLLEECAKIADEQYEDGLPSFGWNQCALKIAAAIRRLKPSEAEGREG